MNIASTGHVHIPEAWQEVTLEHVAVARGGTPFPHRYQGRRSGAYPFYKVSDMNAPGNGVAMADSANWIEPDVVSELGAKPFPRGTTIFPKVGGALLTNKKRLLTRDSVVDNNLMGVTVRDPGAVLPEYLYQWLQSIDLRTLANPGPLPSINARRLYELQIPIPPLEEQRRITRVLALAQRAVENEEKTIAATRELKQAALAEVFARGLRHQPPRDTEIGPLPKDWDVRQLHQLAVVKGGKRLPKGQVLVDNDTGFAYIRVTDFDENTVAISGLKFVPKHVQPTIARYVINKDDVYISIAGTIGMVGMIPARLDGANLTENAARIVVTSQDIEPSYLMRFLDSPAAHEQIRAATLKNAQPKLALTRIEQLVIAVPPTKEEQREIMRVFDAIDTSLRNHLAHLEVLRDLFAALLDKLMTGGIRVDKLDLDTAAIVAA